MNHNRKYQQRRKGEREKSFLFIGVGREEGTGTANEETTRVLRYMRVFDKDSANNRKRHSHLCF